MEDDQRYLDGTTLETLSYLESRLSRLEHILYGNASPPPKTPALPSVQQLEHRFAQLLQRVRTYAELLKIYNTHPTLFTAPSTLFTAPSTLFTAPSTSETAPTTLDPSALLQTILASSPLYPSTASSLTSIADTPIPAPELSIGLAALAPRLRAVEAAQRAQAAEMAELRDRSERVVRAFYQGRVVGYGDWVARMEGRVRGVERGVRRVSKERDEI